jgi:hypothetical protein
MAKTTNDRINKKKRFMMILITTFQ